MIATGIQYATPLRHRDFNDGAFTNTHCQLSQGFDNGHADSSCTRYECGLPGTYSSALVCSAMEHRTSQRSIEDERIEHSNSSHQSAVSSQQSAVSSQQSAVSSLLIVSKEMPLLTTHNTTPALPRCLDLIKSRAASQQNIIQTSFATGTYTTNIQKANLIGGELSTSPSSSTVSIVLSPRPERAHNRR